jgi:hypothetical protein
VTIATALLVFAVGLILRYAIDWHPSGLNLQVVGDILTFVGLLGLIITVWLEYQRQRGAGPWG